MLDLIDNVRINILLSRLLVFTFIVFSVSSYSATNTSSSPAEKSKSNAASLSQKQIEINKVLIDACYRGKVQKVKLLVLQGADIKYRRGPEYGDMTTSLHAAAWAHFQNNEAKSEYEEKSFLQLDKSLISNKVAIIDFLIKKGADVNELSARNNSPLHIAASAEIAEVLIKHGAKVNAHSPIYDMTPLQGSANKHKSVAETLIKHGAKVNSKDVNGKTALLDAVIYNNYELVRLLVDNGADINLLDSAGGSALHYAITNEHKKIAQFLVEKDALYSDNLYFYSSELHDAAKQNNVDVVEWLYKNNKDLTDILDGKRNTALFYAIERNNLRIAEILINHGADINQRGGTKAIPMVFYVDSPEMMLLLLNHGVDLNVTNDYGQTLLGTFARTKGRHYVWDNLSLNILKVLLASGKADINAQDSSGNTPIHIAAREGNAEAIKLLVKYKAGVNIRNGDRETPIYAAIRFESSKINPPYTIPVAPVPSNQSIKKEKKVEIVESPINTIKYLLSHGAEVNLSNNVDETPLSIANSEITRRLLRSYGAK